ncbi:23S rRNA (adenine(1618)-N(6))-methyltransferase RlmF [Vibrio zhugei]|uniref:Ribosomal RNA large subunit methyltransferase F n=1 Tax=Vibrio zhugei TaxID=2479546 RepID=A0ABV7C981_9VIBR|nr:23S rRNA (adenine(1618)-N(6))-methyltransferase RlmF [Vibrio zhugei]
MGTPATSKHRKPYPSSRKKVSRGTKPTPSSGNAVSMNVVTCHSQPGLHAKNRHQGLYNFELLSQAVPELRAYLVKNPRGQWTIPFSDPQAVLLLNQALLSHHYGIHFWQIPVGYLCPPIPGRADYIHRAAELLFSDCPTLQGQAITMLDIGMGANAIYPIIAATEYDWQVVGSDIDPVSIRNAANIVENNSRLKDKVVVRLQSQPTTMFTGIILPKERYALTTCNPPFHASAEEAQQRTRRKLTNLGKHQHKRTKSANVSSSKQTKSTALTLNFGGQQGELWCQGGEASFLRRLVQDSANYATQVLWFSSLISKKDNVRWMKKQLAKVGACDVRIVDMAQGQKISRFIAWSFQNAEQRKQWSQEA